MLVDGHANEQRSVVLMDQRPIATMMAHHCVDLCS